MSYLTDIPENRLNKLIDNCIDKKGNKISIDIILKSKIFEKSEYDDLKVFYNNAQSIKKIEDKESEIIEDLLTLSRRLDFIEIKIKNIEFIMYPTEEEEKEYIKLINEQSKIDEKLLKLKRERRLIDKKNDIEFNKKFNEKIENQNE